MAENGKLFLLCNVPPPTYQLLSLLNPTRGGNVSSMLAAIPLYSDGHTFVYSLLRYRYRYIVSNGRY
jgi:hypothetical protein